MKQFVKNNNVTRVSTSGFFSPDLPKGFYALRVDDFGAYFLEDSSAFVLPPKIYGKSKGFPERVLSTYRRLGKGMSVLLSGKKGTGKTVDAKIMTLGSDMPVITISSAYGGDGFNSFIESVSTPSIFFIDEFEKVYDEEEHRNGLLSIMDGIGPSRHLFILTSNSDTVGEFFTSRPGRVRYHQKYDHLCDDVIEEVINDKLDDEKKRSEVLDFVLSLPEISMDSLVCLIDECNLYRENPKEFISFFNIQSEDNRDYEVSLEMTLYKVPKGKVKGAWSQTNDFLIYLSRHGEEDALETYPEAIKHLSVEHVEFKGRVMGMFENFEDPDFTEYVFLRSDSGETRNYEIKKHNIKSFSKNRNGFRIETHDGKTIKGVPVKPFKW